MENFFYYMHVVDSFQRLLAHQRSTVSNGLWSLTVFFFIPYRQTAGPEFSGPEKAQGEGLEEDSGGMGRVLQRLRWEVWFHPQNHRAHAQVCTSCCQSTDRTVTWQKHKVQHKGTLDSIWTKLLSRTRNDWCLTCFFFKKSFQIRRCQCWGFTDAVHKTWQCPIYINIYMKIKLIFTLLSVIL